MNQRHFLVVGLFRTGGPVTVRLQEGPFVDQQLETRAGLGGGRTRNAAESDIRQHRTPARRRWATVPTQHDLRCGNMGGARSIPRPMTFQFMITVEPQYEPASSPPTVPSGGDLQSSVRFQAHRKASRFPQPTEIAGIIAENIGTCRSGPILRETTCGMAVKHG